MPNLPPNTPRLDVTTAGGRIAAALAALGRRLTLTPNPAQQSVQPPGAALPGQAPPAQSQMLTFQQISQRELHLPDTPEQVVNEMNQMRGSAAGGSDSQLALQAPTSQLRPEEQKPILGIRDFGPLMPLTPRYGPDSPETEDGPRRFQYPMGVNIQTTPRAEYAGLVPFYQLQNISEAFDVAAMCIATRIEQLQGMQYSVTANDKRKQASMQDACDEVEAFFKKPDGITHFDNWIAAAVREHLVTDAITFYPHLDMAGRLKAVEAVDGSTIKPLLDDRGRTMAYQQILYGYPFSEYIRPQGDDNDRDAGKFPTFSTQELMYLPRFTSTRIPYGSPPSEWIIMRVNQALRKQIFDLSYFTSGNIPDMLATLPEGSMSPTEIKEFELWFNAVLEGNDAERRKVRFIPYQTTVQELRPFSYETTLDEWMLRVTCAAYAVPPQELGFTEDVNRATAELQEAVNERRGLKPLSTWIKNAILDEIIHNYFGRTVGQNEAAVSMPGMPTRPPTNPYKQIGWTWQFGDKTDANTVAQTDGVYIEKGVISPDEVRAMRFGQELEGPSPATIANQATLATTPNLAAPGKSAIPIKPIPGSENTPPIDNSTPHDKSAIPIPIQPLPNTPANQLQIPGKAAGAHFHKGQPGEYEQELLLGFQEQLERHRNRLSKRAAARRLWQEAYLDFETALRTVMFSKVQEALRQAGLRSMPQEFRKGLQPKLMEETILDMMLLKAEQALEYHLTPLRDYMSNPELRKYNINLEDVLGDCTQDLACTWATLAENLPVMAAFSTLGKLDSSQGHLVMQPPRHPNCRCKLRVRKVSVVNTTPQPRSQMVQPEAQAAQAAATAGQGQESTPPAEQEAPASLNQPFGSLNEPFNDAGDDSIFMAYGLGDLRKDWASEASDEADLDPDQAARDAARYRLEHGTPDPHGTPTPPTTNPTPPPAPEDKQGQPQEMWVGVWWTDYADACKTLYKAPWGGLVRGCAGLKNMCVSSGPYLGRVVG